MVKNLEILVVEDSESVIETYRDMVDSHNRHDDLYNISIDSVKALDEAIGKLNVLDKTYIGAVVDLDLANSNGEDQSGKKVIEFIKKNLRLPVYVISSTTFNLSGEELEESDLYKVYDRDDDYEFIEDFIKIHSTGITDILNRTGKIEQFINTIYWDHLSSSLLPWIEDEIRSEEDKKQSLIRYCIMHLQEYLDMSSGGDDEFSDYFPAEFFITGPIKNRMFTGDIFTYNSCRYVAITPACDFGNNKADRILCLKINELKKIDDRFIPLNMTSSAKKDLKPLLTNNKPRYHFIPSLYFKNKSYDSGIIDFQNQTSFDFKEISDNSKVERIATISQPFLKDLIERYSRYYARQGAPNISRKQLEDSYLN